jgi:acyl-CoA synthetase (AMP-forming)/AMP-acid ligase II
MRGRMMQSQLTVTSVMRHVQRNFPDVGIVSVTAAEGRHRCSYAEAFARAAGLANALARHGVRAGDRIATLAWNDFRHFEIYYGVAAMGAIVHTVNPRLFPDQIRYIVNHAADRVLFIDPLLVPLLEKIGDALPTLERIIVLGADAELPASDQTRLQSYESFIAPESADYAWPELDESAAAALCYTSGTTGHPKGVLFSHRALVLHALFAGAPNQFGISSRDVVMPVVPMFHANCWGLAHLVPMAGASLVFPGPKMGDGETLQALIAEEGVTFSAAVPTVWMALLDYLQGSGRRIDTLRRVVIGGSACPWPIMDRFEREYGVWVHHAWGMTELSPLGTFNHLLPGMEDLPEEGRKAIRLKQGRGVYGIEMKIVDEQNRELPWDGTTPGLLKVRGPCVCASYYGEEEPDSALDTDGWFATGDVATIDAAGYMQITDRAKDIIKSGGEWISSIELENVAMGHPGIAEAAVIAMPHPKWSERPLLVVVARSGHAPSPDDVLEFLRGRVPKWWLPDRIEFVAEIPHTATGKTHKVALRERFRDSAVG